MNAIETKTAEKINTLHNDIYSLLKNSIDKAIEIGELLTTKKQELPHGEFGSWIKENLIFTDRTARNYMRVFENKDKALEAGNLSEAYKMLEAPKTETVSDLPYLERYSDFNHKLALQDDSYLEKYSDFDPKLASQEIDECLNSCKTKKDGLDLIERVDKTAQHLQNEWGRLRVNTELYYKSLLQTMDELENFDGVKLHVNRLEITKELNKDEWVSLGVLLGNLQRFNIVETKQQS